MAIIYTEETAQDAECECEHEDHGTGGPSHLYGTVLGVWRAATMFGTFVVCTACRNAGHMNVEEGS